MNKARYSYRKLMVLFAVLVLTLVQSVAVFPGAPATAFPLAVNDPNLSNEQRILEQYFNDLVAYQKAYALLNKKASLLPADIDPLDRKANDLQRRVTEVQNAIGEVVKKLKAADKWTSLDADLVANISDSGIRRFFQESSFKTDLEEAAASLSSRSNEIRIPLTDLRKKVSLRTVPFDEGGAFIVRAGYSSPPPMKFVSLACSVGKVKTRLIVRLGGTETNHTLDVVSCNCNSGAGFGLGTGTACSQVLATN